MPRIIVNDGADICEIVSTTILLSQDLYNEYLDKDKIKDYRYYYTRDTGNLYFGKHRLLLVDNGQS